MALKEKRSETVVGIFVLLGFLALGILVVQFGRLGDGNSDVYHVEVEFQDASGLIKGSEVRMGGAKIGRVLFTPKLTDDLTVTVQLSLDDRVKIYNNSEFLIQSVSLIGDKMIVVVPPEIREPGAFLGDGSEVSGGGASGLDALQSDAESVARDARKLMKDARTSLLKFDAALDDIRVVSGRLGDTLEKVNNGVLGQDNLENFKNSIANLEAATASFKDVGEGLEPTIDEVRAAIASVQKAANSAERTFDVVTDEVKELGPAVKELPETIAEFRAAATKISKFVDSADATLNGLSEGDGLLGTLVADEEISANTKTFIKNLKRHGVLGYKDDSTYDERDPQTSRYRGIRR
ncbi:MAG: phospholipid/cholesterol/gamma-HCH transport system substrate-binding protein [Crocinitomicaceae bacterium]|jgi:phospholipid/cholesterol/gamma-HCH transport system substrate-binding protein